VKGCTASTGYQQFTDTSDLPRLATALGARTLVLDIEPLVAEWDGTQNALDRGVGAVLGLVAAIPSVRAVCFATNSARRPAVLPSVPGVNVTYIVSARKPLSVAPYRRLPTPGVVVGDQVLTDGLLARRLGYFFLHYRHPEAAPVGPRVLDGIGQLARPLIFRG
jgi:predicted HAD superfamily phosphohydrolase YqeG